MIKLDKMRANAKKRGVKPGARSGPYKKVKAKRIPYKYKKLEAQTGIPMEQWEAMNKNFMNATEVPTSVGSLPSLISDLASTIDTLEAKLTAQIDRIKSILV